MRGENIVAEFGLVISFHCNHLSKVYVNGTLPNILGTPIGYLDILGITLVKFFQEFF